MRGAWIPALAALLLPCGACTKPAGSPAGAAPPAAEATAPEEATGPLSRRESLSTLLALLEEAKEICLRLAQDRRMSLTWTEPALSQQQFLAGSSVWDAFRGGALARASAELREDERYARLLDSEDLLWLPAAATSVENLCDRLTSEIDMHALDRLVEEEISTFEYCVGHFPQHRVTVEVRAEIVARLSPLVDRHVDDLSRRLRSERQAQEMWRERTMPEPLDAETHRRRRAEYRRWLAARERRETESRKQEEAREAHLAQRRGRDSDVGRRPYLGRAAGGADRVQGLSRLAMRAWYETYRSRSTAFHDERRQYEDALRRRSPRRAICSALEAAARETLTDPETLTSPDPEVRRALQLAVRAHLEAARSCRQGDAAGEAEEAEAAARLLAEAVATLERRYALRPGDELP